MAVVGGIFKNQFYRYSLLQIYTIINIYKRELQILYVTINDNVRKILEQNKILGLARK